MFSLSWRVDKNQWPPKVLEVTVTFNKLELRPFDEKRNGDEG